MTDLVLDSNVLNRWVTRDATTLARLEAAARAGGIVYVPTVCLVESLTGSARDAALNRILKGARVVPLDESLARSAARLRAAVGGDDATDPVVVATAATFGATVLSADPDVGRLAAHAAPPITVLG